MTDLPPEAVAEIAAKPGRWRKPHTMPKDGTPVICGYRWSVDGDLYVTIGQWFSGDKYPGVIAYPNGSYIPCMGWMPLPDGGLHEEFLPVHLRGLGDQP